MRILLSLMLCISSLFSASTITQQVTDASSANPIENVLVTYTLTSDTTIQYQQRTDGNGEAIFPNLYTSIDAPIDLIWHGNFDIQVYNVLGQLVFSRNSVFLNDQAFLTRLGIWEGQNNSGVYVSSGIYFIRIKNKQMDVLTKSMVISNRVMIQPFPMKKKQVMFSAKSQDVFTYKVEFEHDDYFFQQATRQITAGADVAFSDSLWARSNYDSVTVVGKVVDELGVPIDSVTVSLGTNLPRYTDSLGNFEFVTYINKIYAQARIYLSKENYLTANYPFLTGPDYIDLGTRTISQEDINEVAMPLRLYISDGRGNFPKYLKLYAKDAQTGEVLDSVQSSGFSPNFAFSLAGDRLRRKITISSIWRFLNQREEKTYLLNAYNNWTDTLHYDIGYAFYGALKSIAEEGVDQDGNPRIFYNQKYDYRVRARFIDNSEYNLTIENGNIYTWSDRYIFRATIDGIPYADYPDSATIVIEFTPKDSTYVSNVSSTQFIPCKDTLRLGLGVHPDQLESRIARPVPSERKVAITVRDLADFSPYENATVEIKNINDSVLAVANTGMDGVAHLGYVEDGLHGFFVDSNDDSYFSRFGRAWIGRDELPYGAIEVAERILWSDSLHTGEQNITLFEKEMTIPGTEGQTLTGDAAELREVIPTTYHYKESIGMKDIMYLHNFSAIDSSAFMRFTQEIADLFYDGEIPFEFGRTTPFDHDSAGVYVDRGELDKIGWNVYKGGATTDPARYNINGKLAIVGGEIEINFLSIDTKKELQFRRKDNDDVTTRVSYGNPGSTVEPTDKDRAYSNFRTQWETTYSSGHDDFLDLNQTITE
jgi:hypothetical protein